MDCEFIGWCALRPEVQAAWAQAVFSVIGIAVAIAVPWWQNRKAEELRRQDARIAAVSRAALLIKWVKEFAARIDRQDAAYRSRDVKSNIWLMSYPAIPNQLMDQLEHVHELGLPGEELIKAVNHSFEIRDFLQENRLDEKDSLHYEQHLSAMKTHIKSALAGIRKLLE